MRPLVLQGDARQLPLPDESVDLIVTSPPYWSLRSYQDAGEHYAGQIGSEDSPREYIAALLGCTREWMRVLKPSGSMFVNLGDSYCKGQRFDSDFTIEDDYEPPLLPLPDLPTSPRWINPKSLMLLPERYRVGCVYELGLIARAVIVWDKPNGLPAPVTDRVRRSHEDWVHLTKEPRYFSAVDAIREPHVRPKTAEQMARDISTPRSSAVHDGALGVARGGVAPNVLSANFTGSNPLGKLPGSVWEIATEPLRVPEHLGIDHFAAFPLEWPRRIIQGWSPVGGVVLDPFGGTGTTALAASAFGRVGISVDMSADYCRLAQWRTTDPGERARAMRVPKPENPVGGQIGFDFGGEVA